MPDKNGSKDVMKELEAYILKNALPDTDPGCSLEQADEWNAKNVNVTTSSGECRTLAEILDNSTEHKLPDCKNYPLDDIGISNLFADCIKPRLRHVTERKCWYYFDGAAWRRDDAKAMELCKSFVRSVCRHLLPLYVGAIITRDSSKKDIIRFLNNLVTRRARETLLKDASSVHPISFNDFDKKPNLFNCINGTLDLNTGEFYQHRAEDLITKVAGVEYDPDAECPRWERHIDEVMETDKETAVYLQKALGVGLLGENRYECLFILYGPTSRNGKGTTMETYMVMIGDYGRAARPDTITQRRTPNGSGPSEDIARLAGARVVNVSEPDKKMVLSSALVKTLTGNDTITARFLHENSIEYKPTYTFYINTNYLPNVQDPTIFTSGRVKVIPFVHHFDDKQQDKNLKGEFRKPENLSGILNWCLEGLRRLQAEGFDPPEAVLNATAQYQQDSDKFSRFIEECMTFTPGARTQTSEVYKIFQSWCSMSGQMYEGLPKFKQGLQAHTKVDRARIPNNANAVSCVFDYTINLQFIASQSAGDEQAYAPMSPENLNRALAPHGYKLDNRSFENPQNTPATNAIEYNVNTDVHSV